MDVPSPKDHAERVALFRSEVVGALTRRELSRGELRRELKALSAQRFRPPDADSTRTFALPTLERWYYAYRNGGLAALRPKPRSDRGRARDLPEEMRALLLDIGREHPSASVSLIRRTLVADGRLQEGAVSDSTLRRLYDENGLGRRALRGTEQGEPRVRLRWQAEHPGALWHGDVCHGPSLLVGGQKKPLRVHALLDDASRYVVALEAHYAEREVDMLGLLVRALRRHGCPRALYLDNGATYRGEVLRVACERLGITLLHAKPYDAPARGKMERFWRTLREATLDYVSEGLSLAEVDQRLQGFLAKHYHVSPHSSLMGKTPAQVYTACEPPADALDEAALREALTVRARRRLRRDSTLSLGGQDWETGLGYLSGQLVTVGHCLVEPHEAPWLEHDGRRIPLHPVNPTRNAHRKRAPLQPTPKPQHRVAFDPTAALVASGGTGTEEGTP